MPKPHGYHITETLTTSPASCVYRAIKPNNQPVVLRTCGDLATASHGARLRASYEILKGFDHPHIVKAIDFIELSGLPCLVMEDTRSIDLWRYGERFEHKKLPVETVLNIAVQMADALSVIHHAQVIHKDLHPGNILINPSTLNAQIIDFGLASLLSREQPALAPPENLEGILAYISPEQTGRMNRALDYRSDFYTLGVTLYQLLTGELPFEADDAIGLVHAHLARVQIPVSECCSEVPQVVSDIIDKLMYKTAETRYQSALGLKQDLDICRRHLLAGSEIPVFVLGLNDVSDRFQVPQVLYGREQEIKQLMASFYQAAKGTPQLLAVAGAAGIGKSALVHEVHKVIAAHSGVFISGKFDQFQKNVPYSALKHAFSGWVQYALSLKESALLALRERLTSGLGVNARVLIDSLDSFELVLGDLPPLSSLGAEETQNRFHLVLQRFIQLITHDRPLVIFIDDIQWADRGTLNLLPQLMNASTNTDVLAEGGEDNPVCRLLLLVAYRDNEVDDSHPACITLKQIKTEFDTAAESITLQPLPVEQVNQLLAEALHQRVDVTQSLAELVHQKTAGNPFFVNEFLKTLYSEKLLDFDLRQKQWHWSLDEIKAQGITNNVVDLMLGKMRQLPEPTQKILQLAGCIGSQFDLQTLSIISEQNMSATVRQLWPALKEGLLLQEGGDWLLGTMERQGSNVFKRKTDSPAEAKEAMPLTTRMSPLVPQCRFLHDRMLQAAYHSLAEETRQQTHLAIGRLLYKHIEVDQQDAQLFTIVEQLNQGRELIDDAPERLQLAHLNLQAAQKAKQASVWEAAAQYATIGLALLPDACWLQHYDLSFGVYAVLAECKYLLGQAEKSDALYETLLTNTRSGVDKAQLCATRLVQMIGRGQWHKGVDIGIAGMKYLDMQVSSDPEKIEALLPQEIQTFERSLQSTPISAYTDLPEMSDQRCLVALRILPNLSVCGSVIGQTAFMKYFALLGINMSLKAGKSDLMASLLACYALVTSKEEKYTRASELAAQVINISESYPSCREYANSLNMVAATTLYLDSSYQKSIDYHYKGYQRGMESGELARAAINFVNIFLLKFSQGENLKSVEQFAILSRARNKALFLPVPIIAQTLVQALLRGDAEDLYALDDNKFDPDYLGKIKLSFLNMSLLQYQSQLAFWFDKTQEALLPATLLHSQIETFPKFCMYMDHLLQYGLLLCQQLTALDTDKPKLEKQNTEDETNIVFCLSKLQDLSELYAPNFEHKYLLLKAEHGCYQNDSVEQLAPLYEAAIESAATNGFLQYEALANELYGAFLLSKSLPKIAAGCLKEALYLYRRWGCTIKVNNLSKRYQSLLMDEQMRPQAKSATHDAILSSLNQSLTSSSSQTSLSSIGNDTSQTKTQEGLDLSSVMKSAQAISGELEIKGLVAKVMLAILENSGAQNGALILNTKNGTAIEASLKTQPTTDINLESRPLEQAKDVPVSLISYVLRTDSDLVLQDADSHLTSSANMAFIEDPYLQKHQPKSVLCIPVDYREKTIGALYLENPLVHNAFPQQRFDIIKMLLTQAAISFENARLFNEVSELNTGLEEKVQQRTQELHQSNEELNDAVKHLEEANKELDSFSHSISHDLRAPLRAISGFSQILLEDYLVALEPEAQVMLQRVIEGADNMGALISGLLDLSRLQKQSLVRCEVPLSLMAEEVIKNLRGQDTERTVNVTIENGMVAYGDQRMLGSALENLLNNAWKYSSKTEHAEISFTKGKRNGQTLFIIKDNGAGFDMKYIDKLFATFQRLHSETEFEGTGVGLATVKRVINKHGGEIWAEAEKGKGATFYFTLEEA